jgi:hypothetical protein
VPLCLEKRENGKRREKTGKEREKKKEKKIGKRKELILSDIKKPSVS